ncbi:MAG: hypothetical protein A4E71_00556 [Smithella sp. PtaU1.Bin162]|nr:MAG: hypothetical protein A4E71_00556 [Smithella sp. PtaU1.Bin162]
MIHKHHKSTRGWDSIECKMRSKGFSDMEISEARESFCKGIELLSGLFLNVRMKK